MKIKSNQVLGNLIVMIAAIIWGSTGVAAEYLINYRGLSSAWITTYRTTLGGLFMLLFLSFQMKDEIFKVWKDKKDGLQVIIFGLIGVAGSMFTYMLAVEHTNAPTATTLMYLAPAMIVVYMIFRKKQFPNGNEIIGLLCALGGVFAISTHGNINSLVISTVGLIIGFLSAFTVAFYSVYPKNLLAKYGPLYTYAWAQFIAGIIMNFLHPIWKISAPFGGVDLTLILVLAWQFIFGTLICYPLYLVGITLIGPARASMLSSIEPVAAAILAALILATPLFFMDYVGIALISICTIILSIPAKEKLTEGEPDVEQGCVSESV